ncbi:unnamed protein product [Notodromas monacha]|uniref:Uncharacterized protein n=1 Tax=Notodromas monacha TaxID=399045 RepID=A0A7R9BQR1_9CRUS|nr:unnamed protein product [Notodromas monacha]CAG0919016.1 unnamed protein product [Notodromas monacha]
MKCYVSPEKMYSKPKAAGDCFGLFPSQDACSHWHRSSTIERSGLLAASVALLMYVCFERVDVVCLGLLLGFWVSYGVESIRSYVANRRRCFRMS